MEAAREEAAGEAAAAGSCAARVTVEVAQVQGLAAEDGRVAAEDGRVAADSAAAQANEAARRARGGSVELGVDEALANVCVCARALHGWRRVATARAFLLAARTRCVRLCWC